MKIVDIKQNSLNIVQLKDLRHSLHLHHANTISVCIAEIWKTNALLYCTI